MIQIKIRGGGSLRGLRREVTRRVREARRRALELTRTLAGSGGAESSSEAITSRWGRVVAWLPKMKLADAERWVQAETGMTWEEAVKIFAVLRTAREPRCVAFDERTREWEGRGPLYFMELRRGLAASGSLWRAAGR